MANKNGQFQGFFNQLAGKFTKHIHRSIPGYQSAEIGLAKALAEYCVPTSRILDIGASEGTFNILYRDFGGKGTFVNIDPSNEMESTFRKLAKRAKLHPETNQFLPQCFGESFDEENFPSLSENEKFDVILEKFTFQFISNDRRGQVQQMKKHLNLGGVVVLMEKFAPSLFGEQAWGYREETKDRYKKKFFTKAQISEKNDSVLGSMGDCMVPASELENALKMEFRAVSGGTISGNFKYFIAGNSRNAVNEIAHAIWDHANSHALHADTPEAKAYRAVYGAAPLLK